MNNNFFSVFLLFFSIIFFSFPIFSFSEEKVDTHSVIKEQKTKSFYATAKDKIVQVWQEGRQEIHLPIHAWHNREAYPKYKIDRYNEDPWGLGLGKHIINGNGNRERLLAIGFDDSNHHFQPLALYTWQKIWRSKKDVFRFSAGYMAGFTTRKEWHWIPIPMGLPIIGFEIGSVSYENTYIPGLGKDNGNVWFSWASIRF